MSSLLKALMSYTCSLCFRTKIFELQCVSHSHTCDPWLPCWGQPSLRWQPYPLSFGSVDCMVAGSRDVSFWCHRSVLWLDDVATTRSWLIGRVSPRMWPSLGFNEAAHRWAIKKPLGSCPAYASQGSIELQVRKIIGQQLPQNGSSSFENDKIMPWGSTGDRKSSGTWKVKGSHSVCCCCLYHWASMSKIQMEAREMDTGNDIVGQEEARKVWSERRRKCQQWGVLALSALLHSVHMSFW